VTVEVGGTALHCHQGRGHGVLPREDGGQHGDGVRA
jgi:hypothetical protein